MSVTALEPVLKEVWSSEKLLAQLYARSPLLDWRPKTWAERIAELYHERTRTMGDLVDAIEWVWPHEWWGSHDSC